MDIRVVNNMNQLIQIGLNEEDALIISYKKYGYDDEAERLIEIKKQNDAYVLEELHKMFTNSIDNIDDITETQCTTNPTE